MENILNNNELISNRKSYNEFEIIMAIYQKALNNIMKKFLNLKKMINEYYQYDVITNIVTRIKRPESISKKMKDKELNINYENMIENINDIAGMRIICSYKDDIYKIINIIKAQEDIKILKEKDYIKNKKKSGYSAYHIIVGVPIQIKKEEIEIKVEIQIRTVLMDFWSKTEHKVKYKTNKKISKINSIKLCFYAKIIDIISDKLVLLQKE